MTEQPEAVSIEPLGTPPPPSEMAPLRILWRRRWLVLLGAVTGCALGAIFYARSTPVYQSSAQILVVKKSPDALPLPTADGHQWSPDDYLSTQQTLIRSPKVVEGAVQSGKLAALNSFARVQYPAAQIIGGLKVWREINAGNPTTILNISYKSSHAEECPAVLNAVIESYQQFLKLRYKDVAEETSKLITQASDILEKKLSQKEADYNDFSLKHPAILRTKDGLTAVHDRILSLESRRAHLLLQEAEARGHLGAFEKAMQDGRYSRAEVLAMISQGVATRTSTDGASPMATLEERLLALELQEKTLLEDYGTDHPQVRTVRNQISPLRKIMGRPGNDEPDPLDSLKAHIHALRLELANIQQAHEAVAKLIAVEQIKAEPLRVIEKQDEAFRSEIANHKQLFAAVTTRLNEVSLMSNFASGFEAEVISPPGLGGKLAPSPFSTFGVALLLGLVAGFGLAYLAEVSDQSFRSAEEVRRRLGLPVVGHIPFFGPRVDAKYAAELETSGVDPIVCSVHHPKSLESEAYRGVRTAVLFANREKKCKVIQITSPDMGDGKTTLSVNLAVSLAQSGKKVLLLDGDLRRPRVHRIFNVSAAVGLASLIAGDDEFPDAVQATAIPNLSVLPCGPIPPNPAELLTQPRFPELIDYLREQFDFVLIDTPPLLAVTDPSVVVPTVDCVILTIRISQNARMHASRAKEILSTLQARVLGVVVNGVGADSKGYGYDGYRYGYVYRYEPEFRTDLFDANDHDAGPEGHNGTARAPAPIKSFFAWLLNR